MQVPANFESAKVHSQLKKIYPPSSYVSCNQSYNIYVDLAYVLDLLKIIVAAYPAVILPSSLKESL